MRKVATLAQFLAQSVRRMFAAGGDGGTIWGLEWSQPSALSGARGISNKSNFSGGYCGRRIRARRTTWCPRLLMRRASGLRKLSSPPVQRFYEISKTDRSADADTYNFCLISAGLTDPFPG